MLDVGHGDSIYISFPNGKSMLVDTGNKKLRDFPSVNYLVLTHRHYDHMGNADKILAKYKVDTVWVNKGDKGTVPKGIKKIGDVALHFLENKETGENNSSLVFKLVYKKFSMLFTGDIKKKRKKYLIKKYGKFLKSKVYKVAHHGEEYYKPFIETASPELALLSCSELDYKNSKFVQYSNVKTKATIHGDIELTVK